MASSTNRPSTSTDINMQVSESAVINAKILKPLDDVLRCHICFEYFTNCMMTKCNHNYCSVCIRRYMNYKSQCPTCFQVATEPELQNNRLIDEILRIYKKIRETLQISESTNKSFSDHSTISKSAASDNLEKSVRNEGEMDIESKQQNTDGNTLNEVSCPVCYTTVPNSRINMHLDSCLKQTDERHQRKSLPKLVYYLISEKDLKKKLKEYGLSTAGNKQSLIRRHKNFVTLYNANCDSLNPKPVSDLILEIERQELEERINTPQKTTQVNKKSDPSLIEREHESYVQEHKSQFNVLIQDVQERAIGQGHKSRLNPMKQDAPERALEQEHKSHLNAPIQDTQERVVEQEHKSRLNVLIQNAQERAIDRKPVKEEFGFTEGTSNITDETGNIIGETTLKVGNATDSDQPVIIKEEPSKSLLQDAYHTENPTLVDKDFDSGYNNTSKLSFRIKKETAPVKMKNSPSLLDDTMNQDLNVDRSSLEDFGSSKMSISNYQKKKNARRLSTEEKNTQRKK